MKQQIHPAIVWVGLGVVLVVVIAIGFKVLNSQYTKDTKGSDQTMEKFKKEGSFYNPPIPGGAPGAGNSNGGNSAGGPASAPGMAPTSAFKPPDH